ncbi:unnamed protein product [Moneuplotes crassus]|uniref:Uncharacterized protein n=1 Tax=Euplotes crassus TaxID=5936 RepID=A0AAD1XB21_EUPCR|nr:unnamed protein product [Moneuplotes crassus]
MKEQQNKNGDSQIKFVRTTAILPKKNRDQNKHLVPTDENEVPYFQAVDKIIMREMVKAKSTDCFKKDATSEDPPAATDEEQVNFEAKPEDDSSDLYSVMIPLDKFHIEKREKVNKMIKGRFDLKINYDLPMNQ